jgi:outer membrane lipoprotein-sorting protein
LVVGLILTLLTAGAAWAEPLRFASVVAGMQVNLAETVDYQCRLETWSSDGGQEQLVILAYAFRRPDKIRMEVLEGPYEGSLLIYNREIDPNRVRVRAGHPLMAFLQRLVYGEYFALNHQWVVDKRGNGIHESHWPYYAAQRRKYVASGRSRFIGAAVIDGRPAYHFRLEADGAETRWGFHREDVWVDAASYFPVQLHQYDASGRLVRRARATALRFNTGIDLNWFRDFEPSEN